MTLIDVHQSDFHSDFSLPLIVDVKAPQGLETARAEIQAAADEHLPKAGALLFRGLGVQDESGFENFVKWFSDELQSYDYGSTPRTRLSGKVYTSTEYPPSQTIDLHNEMAYSRSWPMKLWFFSMKVATKGGETPIADSRVIYNRIPQALREKFAEKELLYTRNYRVGMDVPWQKVFNTDDKAEVERFCEKEGIEYEWKNGDELSTRQQCQAVARHPNTDEWVWFNQAHLFHISNLESRFRTALMSIYKDEHALPRNVFFGDGSPISDEELDVIRGVIQSSKVTFPWQEGDIMMVDNMLAAHGREPFEGERKVVVAMADGHSL